MYVLCLEGCHGCGKTSLLKAFERAGLMVLDEAFLDMPSYGLHPQTLLMETTWVSAWFSRILCVADKLGDKKKDTVVITDRSPFSAVFYSDKGELLEPCIRQYIEEVKDYAGIRIQTLHVAVEDDPLWERIYERVQLEPERYLLKEHQRSWMDKVKQFYTNFKWDFEIDNSLTNNDLEDGNCELMGRVTDLICESSPEIRPSLKTCAPSLFFTPKTFCTLTESDEEKFDTTEKEILTMAVEEKRTTVSGKRIVAL